MSENETDGTNSTLAKNRKAMASFIDKLRNSGNIRASCEAAVIPRTTAYRWRRTWKTFADEWDQALEDAIDILEAKAWKRAAEESDRLLMFLLKAHRREKYGDHFDVTTGGESLNEGTRLSEDARIRAMAALFAAVGAILPDGDNAGADIVGTSESAAVESGAESSG